MKLFVLAIVAAALVGASGKSVIISEKFEAAIRVACVEETGVDDETVNQYNTGKIPDTVDDLKKFAFCTYQKYGIINDNGTLNKEISMSKLSADVNREEMSKHFDVCKKEKGDNPQETVFLLYKCKWRQMTNSA